MCVRLITHGILQGSLAGDWAEKNLTFHAFTGTFLSILTGLRAPWPVVSVLISVINNITFLEVKSY